MQKNNKYVDDTIKGNSPTIVSVGIVLRMPLELVPRVKEFLSDLPETRIVYQRITASLLRIVDEQEEGLQ